jgi:hypothetical protein
VTQPPPPQGDPDRDDATLPNRFWMLQVAGDAAAVLLAFVLGYDTYHLMGFTRDQRALELYLRIGAAAAVVLVLIYERLELYRPQVSVLHIHEFRGVTRGVIAGATCTLALSFYYRDASGNELSRLVLSFAFVWLLPVAKPLAGAPAQAARRALHARPRVPAGADLRSGLDRPAPVAAAVRQSPARMDAGRISR